jgi:septal ring factor EnvC (AmiA/AmiB activator)
MEKTDYIKRLEKRNVELEKKIIDTETNLRESEARVGYKDGRIEELEERVEQLERIRKDIMSAVNLGGNSMDDRNASTVKKV